VYTKDGIGRFTDLALMVPGPTTVLRIFLNCSAVFVFVLTMRVVGAGLASLPTC